MSLPGRYKTYIFHIEQSIFNSKELDFAINRSYLIDDLIVGLLLKFNQLAVKIVGQVAYIVEVELAINGLNIRKKYLFYSVFARWNLHENS